MKRKPWKWTVVEAVEIMHAVGRKAKLLEAATALFVRALFNFTRALDINWWSLSGGGGVIGRARLRPGNMTWQREPAIVCDPFGGSGTVGRVSKRLRRDYVLIEIKPEYAEMARQRIEYGTVEESQVREQEQQLTLFDISYAKLVKKPSGWKTGPGNHCDLTGRFREALNA